MQGGIRRHKGTLQWPNITLADYSELAQISTTTAAKAVCSRWHTLAKYLQRNKYAVNPEFQQ